MQLVVMEVTGIQPYVFGSNRMRENVGASFLVNQATEKWAMEALKKLFPGKHNLTADNKIYQEKRIEDPEQQLDVEVLYCGGGNFVALFRGEESDTKKFFSFISRKVLTEAPGLQLVAVQETFEWTKAALSQKVKTAMDKLESQKRAWLPSIPLLGLGVTVMCRSTGLPATGYSPPFENEPREPVSAEIVAKLNAVDNARRRLVEKIPIPQNRYQYPHKIEYMGASHGEFSYIAVVHIDGNDMGRRKKAIGKSFPTPENNRPYIEALRNFSQGVNEASLAAFWQALDMLLGRIAKDGGSEICEKSYDKKQKREVEITNLKLKKVSEEAYYLPFLPLIYGGDDVTFICDGRLGLSLALAYIRAFEAETENRQECLGKITSCAGVAIVKSHYPFAQAYNLAEELCQYAKRHRLSNGNGDNTVDCSYLDWHFSLTGITGSIGAIREREYETNEGSLILRPLTVGKNPWCEQRAWEVVEQGIKQFRGDEWIGRRNKVKALREALREGRDAVKQFIIKYGELPQVNNKMVNWPTEGWEMGYCGYFDAIELADWHIPLEEGV